jgi:hypothetical protein
MLSIVPYKPVSKDDEVDVAKEFKRFLRASGDILNNVFTETILSRNDALEKQNKTLMQIIWREYSAQELRKTIVQYNRRGYSYFCTCFYCCKSANPMLIPLVRRHDRDCKNRFFIKMAINRAGLSFSCPHTHLNDEVFFRAPLDTPVVTLDFSREPSHLVFADSDNIYSIEYGARILSGDNAIDTTVYTKLHSLFRMIRERLHHTYPYEN